MKIHLSLLYWAKQLVQRQFSTFDGILTWSNLLLAYRKAAKHKRGKSSAATFEHQLADRLLELQSDLINQSYVPGDYVHFTIHDPKTRKISAAPFRDRVVHHALCNIIEPLFEAQFIPDSYANRKDKGTHRACDRLQSFAKHYRYVLRIDIGRVLHFINGFLVLNVWMRLTHLVYYQGEEIRKLFCGSLCTPSF